MDILFPSAWHWIAAALCAMIIGAAKTGIPGLGFLAVPWMAFLFHDRVALSAGALLPLLCCADIIAVWMFRRRASVHHLWHLLPWVLIGLACGWASLVHLDNATLRPALGGIILAMIGLHLWRALRP
ncbi:MAG: TSUP family transporter, partial [Planctomycetota bacterium]